MGTKSMICLLVTHSDHPIYGPVAETDVYTRGLKRLDDTNISTGSPLGIADHVAFDL